MINIKQKIFMILKNTAPQKHNAWSIAELLQMQGHEKSVTRLCFILTQNFKMIHMEKINNDLFWYYKNEETARGN